MPSRDNLRIFWPRQKIPAVLLVDDPVPCRNPAWYEFPYDGHEPVVPISFLEAFADLLDQYDVKGKFSLIPCPGATGRIDSCLPGIGRDELELFLTVVRERIARRCDISPELLTHNYAMDITAWQPLDEREDVWFDRQDLDTMVSYISTALEILTSVGLSPNGVTSPWRLGAAVEDLYCEAIRTSLKAVTDTNHGWYFVHCDDTSEVVSPRLSMCGDGESLVSIVSGTCMDFAWHTQKGRDPDIDLWITEDGLNGRLGFLLRHQSPLVMTTHWQSLFSNGSWKGLEGLREVIRRIDTVWRKDIIWMTPSQLASYYVAMETAVYKQSTSLDGGITLSIEIAQGIDCHDFTFQLTPGFVPTKVFVDGVILERVQTCTLTSNTWYYDEAHNTCTICCDISNKAELSLQ